MKLSGEGGRGGEVDGGCVSHWEFDGKPFDQRIVSRRMPVTHQTAEEIGPIGQN